MTADAWLAGGRASLEVLLAAAAVPPLAATTYLGVLAAWARRPSSVAVAAASVPLTRFDVVVPAHDEEAGIARTIASLAALDYPASMFRVVVVADNCSDATAERARAAGATVLERVDTQRRGKGYALSFAFDACLRDGRASAVVVVDADTSVSPGLLCAFDRRSVPAIRRCRRTTAYVMQDRAGARGWHTWASCSSTACDRLLVRPSVCPAGCVATGCAFIPSCCAECHMRPARSWRTWSTALPSAEPVSG